MTTTNRADEARSIAELVVKEGLAACVQIVPKIESIYEWDGKIHADQEHLLLIKTFEDRIGAIKKMIEEKHSYEVPEFLVVPVIDGAKDYLKWMEEGTK
ncbi:MAG: divalent-cation tolerance protein CutA [Proteobacteria bacterium]|nr:divalent-cation tolerance protein CutA [Pseudomonadota bacterium]